MSTNLLLSGHSAEILSVDYDSTSRLLASGSIDKSILLWSVSDSYQNIAVLKGHTNAITSLQFTLNDRLIASSADKTVSNWDVEMEKVVRKYKGHRCIVHDVAAPKKARDILASVSDDGFAKGWEQRTKKQIFSLETKYPLTSACFSLNGERLFIGGLDTQIKIYDLTAGKIEEAIEGHQDTVSCLQLSYDGTYLMSNSFDETIRIWDVRPTISKRLTKTLSGHSQGNEKGLIRGSWSKDGLYIACGSIDKCVYIWDTTTRKIVQRLGGHSGTVNHAVLGENNKLASGSNDRNIIVSQLPEVFL